MSVNATYERMFELAIKIADLKIEIAKLTADNEQLRERVKYLQEQNLELIKSQPQRYVDLGRTMTPAGCSVCGITFTGNIGYVCTRSDCPTRITC